MRIGIASDTHEEMWSRFYTQDYLFSGGLRQYLWFEDIEPCDVFVVAGDITPVRNKEEREILYSILRRLRDQCTNVVYVAGNHEYYGSNLDASKYMLGPIAAEAGAIFLDNSDVVIDGVRFYGGTMWTNFNGDTVALNAAINGVSDFRVIEGFTHDTCIQMFDKYIEGLEQSNCDVVISHFLPDYRSVHPVYAGSTLNNYFVGQCPTELLTRHKLWIHGHTHSNMNYYVENTRVVANPRGYPGENFSYRQPTLYKPKYINI
jgi:DNA repair exonuclease SbcCD nuclease subunit